MHALVRLKERGLDDLGSGAWGASRGARIHNGVDYCAEPGQHICSPVNGWVSKLGHPYSDDLDYRYVEVTDGREKRHRFFYVKPSVSEGDKVTVNQVIGVCQNISAKHSSANMTMKNHVHYEIKLPDGSFEKPV